MSASPASKPVHSGTDAAKVARLTTRPPQRSASSWRRGTSRRIRSAPTAGRKVTTVSRPIGGRLICLRGGAPPRPPPPPPPPRPPRPPPPPPPPPRPLFFLWGGPPPPPPP